MSTLHRRPYPRKILLTAQRDQPEGIPSSHSYLGHFAIFQTMQVQNAGH